MKNVELEKLFSGLIGEEYELLKAICPEAAEMSERVGECVADYQSHGDGEALKALEIGCGTGITALAVLNARDDLVLSAVDNEPTMLNQARDNLAPWLKEGRLNLIEQDALSYLREMPAHSLDVVASAYALHNFLDHYRNEVLAEIFRVLRPGGLFVNGDRYALDDVEKHLQLVQSEVRLFFARIAPLRRYDVLEQWIVHLFSDESPHHIMRTRPALDRMEKIGFEPIEVLHRQGVNALVTGRKPQR